jgi:hypothetical protein
MVKMVIGFAIGLLFGLGVTVAGMINPAKVQNFFDIFDPLGRFDPSLALVIGAALAVTIPGYRLVLGGGKPMLDRRFHVPQATTIDSRLIGGAATFGVGWGLSGYCPGGVIPALGLGRLEPLIFAVALLAGMAAARLWLQRLDRQAQAARQN